jgi:D-alanyl-D-alanine carboxypeptidase
MFLLSRFLHLQISPNQQFKRLSRHAHQLFTFLEQMDIESDNNRADELFVLL